MIITGLVGYLVQNQNGFPSRDSIIYYQSNHYELTRTIKSEPSCDQFLGIKDRKFVYCRVGYMAGDETIAVIGDSHAHASFPGIADGLAKYNINTVLLANSGCPLTLGRPTGKTADDKLECKERTQQILDTVMKRDDIKTIIFINRGTMYWTGEEPAMPDNKRKYARGSISKDDYIAGLQATIDIAVKNDKRMIYLTENPELKIDVKNCLPRPLNDSNASRCEQDVDSVTARQASYLEAIKDLKNVEILNTQPIFCKKSDVCDVVNDEGKLLYADDDHLSVLGSSFQFEQLIEPYLAIK